jgi:hypothetical protein
MPDHELVNIIASADAAINAEDFDALMTFYAEDATLVIEPGRWVTGQTALREAFVAIAEHFTHSLRVSQEEMLVIEGAGTATRLAAHSLLPRRFWFLQPQANKVSTARPKATSRALWRSQKTVGHSSYQTVAVTIASMA